MIVVVDASAVAAICFGEPDGPAVAERFTAAELWSTPLLDFELANVAWKKLRRAPAMRDVLMRGLESRSRLPITVRGVAFAEVVDLASSTGLTAYDASYLWLARHLGAELLTLDKRLEGVALTAA